MWRCLEAALRFHGDWSHYTQANPIPSLSTGPEAKPKPLPAALALM